MTSHEGRDTNGLNNFIGVGCGVSSRHVEPHVEFHGRFSSIFKYLSILDYSESRSCGRWFAWENTGQATEGIVLGLLGFRKPKHPDILNWLLALYLFALKTCIKLSSSTHAHIYIYEINAHTAGEYFTFVCIFLDVES